MIPANLTSTWVNHLWQSTIVVGVAWLLALALRRNQARVRYWVWMAASVKFLLPFALLIGAGEWLRSLMTAPVVVQPALASVMDQITQPFPQAQSLDFAGLVVAAQRADLLPLVLLAIWACGALIVVARWTRGWLRIRAAMRAASPLTLAADVPVLSTSALLEPGIFGIFRPVLLLPEGILHRLTPSQLDAIIAHEMCHVRRRDNLTFAVHMIVEALFWFFPLVWWIGARMIEERERACDEAVLQAGGDAEVYAEGILNVCKMYVESPLECAAGVSGSDLKKRIVRIMAEQVAGKLTSGRKVLLGAAGVLAVAVPLVIGGVHAEQGRAQTQTMPEWQQAAGGHMEFEVASVREDTSGGRPYSNFSLDNGNAYFTLKKDDVLTPNGSLFMARNQPLMRYIIFAYKLGGTQELALRFGYFAGLDLHVPAWINDDRFDIEARAPGTATKDQMRLMMQSLLADRFKLAVGTETRRVPVFAMVMDKPGELGPQLRRHPASDDCTTTKFPENSSKGDSEEKFASAIPIPCGEIAHLPPSAPGRLRFGGRNVTLAMLAESLPTQTGMATLPRPVIDETGLEGGFDFSIEWAHERSNPSASGESPGSGAGGPTFLEALREQLGLKVKSTKGPIQVLVIEHVQRPSPN